MSLHRQNLWAAMIVPAEPIRIRVTPRAKKEGIEEGKKGTLHVSVKEPAEMGKANVRTRELLAAYFGVPLKNVLVTKGVSNRSKMVIVHAHRH